MRVAILVALALAVRGTASVRADDLRSSFNRTAAQRVVQAQPVRYDRSITSAKPGVVESPNFRVTCRSNAVDLADLADRCERLAAASRRQWVGPDSLRPWVPKCEIVVHRDAGEYTQFLGAGSEQTSGCATLRLEAGRVVVRRIDLRADAVDWMSESLPHELMHVVLADRFANRRLAPRADEGIAMLSESASKRKRRLEATRSVVRRASYSSWDLMNVRTSPSPAHRDAFYGQSVALVSLVLERGGREQFLQFLEAAQFKSPAAAFAEIYGEAATAQLDRDLDDYIFSDRLLRTGRLAVAFSNPQQMQALR